ncbi:hypothetical protein V8C26DRAFT_405145 [Trichoderma gracile]
MCRLWLDIKTDHGACACRPSCIASTYFFNPAGQDRPTSGASRRTWPRKEPRLSKGCVRGRSNRNGDDFVLLCGVREPPILTAPMS